MYRVRTWEEEKVEKKKRKAKQNRLVYDDLVSYVLSKPIELAGPDLLCIAIVDDVVVGIEAAVVEI